MINGILKVYEMEDNTYMLAYDVPLSALLFILWAGVIVEHKIGSEEQRLAHMEYIRSLYEDENDGL
jgi:hypothetical protein